LRAAVLDHLQTHYVECQESFRIYDAFLNFVNQSAAKEIAKLLEKKNQNIFNEYSTYLNALKKYERALAKFPPSIFFPLFEVSIESATESIRDIIKELKQKIFGFIEGNLFKSMKGICNIYSDFALYLRKSLNTAEEVEEMEKKMYIIIYFG